MKQSYRAQAATRPARRDGSFRTSSPSSDAVLADPSALRMAMARPATAGAREIAALQRLAGNQAVLTRFLQRAPGGTPPAAPPAPAAAAPAGPVHVGYVYTIRGEIKGEAVYYTGQTARDIADRLYKDGHTWADLIRAKTTTIEFHPIKAVLNVQESSRQTLASARREALSAAEEVIKQRRGMENMRELNKIAAAEEQNILKFGDRHQVIIGARQILRPGVKIGGFVGFQLLDFFLMYRDSKLAQYVMAPYLLEDEQGIFTLQEQDRGLVRPNHFFKNYETGPLSGQNVPISREEFLELKREAELLWGTTDWKGDFVPGLLNRELPVMEVPDAPDKA